MSSGITIEDYSERAIAVFGNWQPYTELLKSLGGLENERLGGGNSNGVKRHGWIFSKKKRAELEKALKEGEPSTLSVKSVKATTTSSYTPSASSTIEQRLDKLEKLVHTLASTQTVIESEVAAIRKTLALPSQTKKRAVDEDDEDEDMGEDDVPAVPIKSLIQRKR
jgi:vacuolar-type H+-ATPase subunit I/STV1